MPGPIKRGPISVPPRGPGRSAVSLQPSPAVLFGGNIGLWINGVNYTAYLVATSPHITNTGYSQTGVFRFRLQSPAS